MCNNLFLFVSSTVTSCLPPKMDSLPVLSLSDCAFLEHLEQADTTANTAMINTLNDILEPPLDCPTMKSTNLSALLPPFLAPLVPVAEVLEGKDFWSTFQST